MREGDWYDWHDRYDTPGSGLARRLAVVQHQIGLALDGAAPGPIRALSMCAGQGRDLIGALAGHPRRDDVTGRLVELDPRNAAFAARSAEAAGLHRIEVRVGDAALIDQYADLAPADLVLVCGVFGNVSDTDVEATIGYLDELCATGGTVIWTRHRKPPDLVPAICRWFDTHGFQLRWLSDPDAGFGVGVHRFTSHPGSPTPGARMFSFVGHKNDP
jgi:hypothetical protein